MSDERLAVVGRLAFLLAGALVVGACSGGDAPPPPPVDSGTPLTLGESCTSGACATDLRCTTNLDFPSTTCEQPCDLLDGGVCPANYECESLATGNWCLKGCASNADCQPGEACIARADTSASFCVAQAEVPPGCGYLPHVVSGGAVGPQVEPAACVTPVSQTVMPVSQVQHLGVFPVNSEVTFEVPAGTYGLTVVAQSVDAGTQDVVFDFGGGPFAISNAVVPLQLIDANGTVIYDDLDAGTLSPEAQELFYDLPPPVTGAITLPNTSQALTGLQSNGGLPAGTWRYVVNDYANECAQFYAGAGQCDGGSSSASYDLTVVTRSAPPNPGRLDAAFYLVDAPGLTSATAPGSPKVARMVSAWASLYGAAGICPGTVTFYDVPAWAQAKYTSINVDDDSPCSDLNQMFTLSQPGDTLNYFLVGDLVASDLGGGEQVVGLDGTIPGPSSFGGTVSSGAAVSAADLSSTSSCGSSRNYVTCGPDEIGYIAAHEGGHWMGLYHTTESDGEEFDPLTDTPTCSCDACVSGARKASCADNNPSGTPTEVTGTDCDSPPTCGGGDDLMFWLLDTTAQGTLSSQQGQVMRGNLLVH